jgi:hypothetical protein
MLVRRTTAVPVRVARPRERTSTVDSLEFMRQVGGERRQLSPIEGALAAARAEDQRQGVEDKRAAAEKQAALESQREAQAFAESQWGQPTAELRRCQEALGQADEAVAELREKLRKAEARQASYRSNVEFWAQRAQLVVDAVTRSRPDRLDPFEQAQARAQIALDDADRRGRATMERARAQVARRRARPSFRSTAATAPAHLADDSCCLYSTSDGMPHDRCWPDAPYADPARSNAVLAEFASRRAASGPVQGRVSYR